MHTWIVLGIAAAAPLVRGSASVRHSLGLCLLPQAGVAIGMALLASQRHPAIAEALLTVALASTVVFELGGPVLTRWCLTRWSQTRPANCGTSGPAGNPE